MKTSKPSTAKNSIISAGFWLGCFLTPIALMTLACLWGGVYPFGSESFLTEDLKYQYVDLFTWFRRVILGDTSVFYQDNVGLGSNAWGLVSYYLSSPFNLLLLFFDEEHLTDFAWLITALKLGFIQVSAVWYLKRRFSLSNAAAFALALCFTWSLWTATQLRNPLWLDGLILLPLGAYGVFLLVREKRWIPLAIILAIGVITCWYVAYMLILFLSLLAVFELIVFVSECGGLSAGEVIRRIAFFILALAFAVLLSAFTFLPTVMAMMGGSGGSFPVELLAARPRQVLAGFFIGNWVYSVPQHFAGTLLLLLTVAFFVVRGIKPSVKVSALVFLMFMIASAVLFPLLYVWSGMRVPNGFYCRITFLTAFLMLWMAARAFRGLSDAGSPTRPLMIASVVVVAAVVASLVYGGVFAGRRFALITVVLVVIYGVVVWCCVRQKGRSALRVAAVVALCVLPAVELLYGAHLAWSQLYKGYTQEYHETYIAESKAQIEELGAADDGLYRIDKTYTRAGAAALNEGLVRNYLALSTYVSSQDASAVNMLADLGYTIGGTFSVKYSIPVLATDSLLGVKYVSTESKPVGFVETDLEKTITLTDKKSARFYRNPYALPLGYGVADSAVGFIPAEKDNPFECQNGLVSALVGSKTALYQPMHATVSDEGDGWRTYAVEVPAGAIGYVYTRVPSGASLWVSIDDGAPFFDNHRWRHAVTPLDEASPQEALHSVTVSTREKTAEADQDALPADAECLFYYMDVDTLAAAVDVLAAHPCMFSVFESGHIEASYQADESGFALLTIPAAKGWTATVNGREVAFESVFDGGLMLIPVEAGVNHIELKFVSPGFMVGCLVSAFALAALLALGVLGSRRRRQKISKPAAHAKC